MQFLSDKKFRSGVFTSFILLGAFFVFLLILAPPASRSPFYNDDYYSFCTFETSLRIPGLRGRETKMDGVTRCSITFFFWRNLCGALMSWVTTWSFF